MASLHHCVVPSDSVQICVVAYSAVVREPIFLCSGVLCRISRDTGDKRTFMCMLCCSMVRCAESVLFSEPQKKGDAIMVWMAAAWRHQRMVIMICSLALSRLNNGTFVGMAFVATVE